MLNATASAVWDLIVRMFTFSCAIAVDRLTHAGSTAQTWDQLALMVKASVEGAGLEFAVIKRLLMMTIDIVVHIKAHAGRRYITGIDFDPGRVHG